MKDASNHVHDSRKTRDLYINFLKQRGTFTMYHDTPLILTASGIIIELRKKKITDDLILRGTIQFQGEKDK